MTKKPHRMAVFDLDGTLLNTTEGILAAIVYTAHKMKLPLPSNDVLASACIGPPIEKSFAALFALHGDALRKACQCFRTRYATHELYLAEPYAKIFAVLQALKARGVLIGVATYKRESYALPLLAHFDLMPLLDVACGTRRNECKAAVLTRALCELEIAPADAVMIGDTASDAEAADAVGTDFIGVTYGFGFQKTAQRDKISALGFAKSPIEILNFIRSSE